MNISGSPLVLRRFQIDETGTSGANVWIEARQSGIINFLLTVVGLDPNSSRKVTRGSISFRNSSVFGSSQVSTPLANIGAFVGGYKKPFLALVSAVLFFLTGFASLAAAGDDGGRRSPEFRRLGPTCEGGPRHFSQWALWSQLSGREPACRWAPRGEFVGSGKGSSC